MIRLNHDKWLRNLKVVTKTTDKAKYVCVDDNCCFKMIVTRDLSTNYWEVTTHKKHSCTGRNGNPLRAADIARCYLSLGKWGYLKQLF